MLVLNRYAGEKIVIGTGPDAIVITVTCVSRDKVRLGIEAPKHMPISRPETEQRVAQAERVH